jgi:hypothetical protein
VPAAYDTANITTVYGGWVGDYHYVGATPAVVSVNYKCVVPPGDYCLYTPSYVTFYKNGDGCTLYTGSSNPAACTVTTAGYGCYNFQGANGSDGKVNWTIYSTFTQCGGNNAYSYYSMPDNCGAYANNGANTRAAALAAVRNNLDNRGYSTTLARHDQYNGNTYCSDTNGNYIAPGNALPGKDFWQSQNVSGWRFSYDPNSVQDLQYTRLANAIPPGYIQASASVCGSVQVVSVDASNQTAKLACAASERVIWAWTASEQTSLKDRISGLAVAQALSTINSTQGVVNGTAAISQNPSNASEIAPVSAITLTIGG